MLLIISNKSDLATDYLIYRMHQRGIPFVRLNTEDFLDKWEVNFELKKNGTNFFIEFSNKSKLLRKSISGAYIRQPLLPKCEVFPGDEIFAEREIGETLKSLWRLIDEKLWFNAPYNILRSSNKIEQLHIAKELGFNIPNTCVSCNKSNIVDFYEANGKNIIAKAVKHGFIYADGEARVAPTQLIDDKRIQELDQCAKIPMIFQRHISKIYDVRVTVVGNKVFPVAIYSQDYDETKIDWRLSNHHKIDLKHEAVNLPKQIESLCKKITSNFKLKYSAIDLVLSDDGDYYFLELNPNGQWAWIEQLTNHPIRDAIIDELIHNSGVINGIN